AADLILISKRPQKGAQLRQIGNPCAPLAAIAMRFAKIEDHMATEEILIVQLCAEIVQINNAVPNLALRVELRENQISHPKIRAVDRQLTVRDSIFPLDLPGGIERAADFVGRIGNPVISQLGNVERDV